MGLPGLAFRTWRSCGRAGGTAAPWWRGTPEVSPPSGWNEAYEPAILWGGGRADCPGLPRPTWKGAPAALGLGPAWLGPGGLRTLRSAQRTRGLASCALCGEFNSAIGGVSRGLTGRTGYHPGLNYHSTGPINCLARTRSAGSRRGPVLPGWRPPSTGRSGPSPSTPA